MTCSEAREALLSADLAALQATAGPLRDHLAACEGCRRDADRILAASAALRSRVARPSPDATVAARRAIAAGRDLMRARRRWRIVPLLAAAAAVAAILLVPRDRATDTPGTDTAAQPALPPLVDAAGAHVAVITTRRPDITVVWQF